VGCQKTDVSDILFLCEYWRAEKARCYAVFFKRRHNSGWSDCNWQAYTNNGINSKTTLFGLLRTRTMENATIFSDKPRRIVRITNTEKFNEIKFKLVDIVEPLAAIGYKKHKRV
jgi:hypothetical protein